MISIKEYKTNPCKALSIPYWKAKSITIPSDMKIVHSSEFEEKLLENYDDSKFFRLKHNLKNIPLYNVPEIELSNINFNNIDELVNMINSSYTHSQIRVTADDIKNWINSKVYCSDLWIGAFEDEKLIGSIICEFDSEVSEGVIEWLQVLPEYRNRGIAAALCSKALMKMSKFADFATVSGECDNITNPEKVYRKCGFEGDDVWNILKEK